MAKLTIRVSVADDAVEKVERAVAAALEAELGPERARRAMRWARARAALRRFLARLGWCALGAAGGLAALVAWAVVVSQK